MAHAKKRQKFFDVDMPVLGKETQLYAYDTDELKNRIIKYDLTRILRGKGALMELKVSVDGEGKATSSPVKINLMPYFLRRMVRKGTNYVENSFAAETKDAKARVKLFLVTRKKVPKRVRRALRNKAKEEMDAYMKGKTVNEIFEEILKNRLQKQLSLTLKKIYPLSLCEIRSFEVKEKIELKNSENPENKKSAAEEEKKTETKKEEAAEKKDKEKKPKANSKKTKSKETKK